MHLPLTSGERLMTKLNTLWCQVQRCKHVEKKFTKSERDVFSFVIRRSPDVNGRCLIQSIPNPNLRYSLRFSQIFFQHVCKVAFDTMTCLVLSSDVHQTLTEDA